MTDKYYVYRPLLDLIGFTEGTDKGDGYNETLAYGAYTEGDVDLVSMTLAEVDKLQTKMLAHPKNKLKSSAAGRYQIVRTTRRSIEKTLALAKTLKFDKAMQDRMACYLLGVRGIDKYLAGRLKEDTLIDNLAKEWASLPTTAGKGHYAGQHSAVSVKKVRAVLGEVMARHKEGQVVETVEVEKPVVPPAVEKQVRQKTNWLGGIFGGLFGTGGFAAWVAGMDKDSLLLVAGIAAVVIVVVLVGGELLVRRVKAIGKALEE